MKRLILNYTLSMIILIGGVVLMQPSKSVASSNAALITMAECEDEHGDMEGDVCGRDDNGNCLCYDYPEQT